MIERENDWRMRKTKEAFTIRLQGAVMNRDQGTFLSGIYDPLFVNLRKIGGISRGSKPPVSCSHAHSSSEDVHSSGRNSQLN